MASEPVPVRVYDTPVIATRVLEWRDQNTSSDRVVEIVEELSNLMMSQVANTLKTGSREVRTPLELTVGYEIVERVVFVPIVRAGEGMLRDARRVLPGSLVWHLGYERVEQGGKVFPRQYLDKTQDVKNWPVKPTAIVLDPMFATAGSAIAACTLLKERHVPRIIYVALIAAPEGIEAFQKAHPDVELHVAVVDRELNDKKYILPGIGDAGDRLYPTTFPGNE